jgi:hypothetical protein
MLAGMTTMTVPHTRLLRKLASEGVMSGRTVDFSGVILGIVGRFLRWNAPML